MLIGVVDVLSSLIRKMFCFIGEGEVADDHGNQEAGTVENIRSEEENHHADVHDENEDHDHQQEEEID